MCERTTIFNGATRASTKIFRLLSHMEHLTPYTNLTLMKFLKTIETVNSKYFILAHDIKNLGQLQNKTLELDRTTSTKQNSLLSKV